ncbi:hypothetical protein ACVWZT_001451 [Pseudomonas sp. TE21394]
MKKAIIEPVTTAGVETFLAAGNPSLNCYASSPVSRWMLSTSTFRS